jgi:histone H3/H4
MEVHKKQSRKTNRKQQSTVEPTVEPTVESIVESTVESTVEPTVEPTVESTVESTEIKNKKKKTRYFETYISKILKQLSVTNGITSNAKQQLNSVICIIARNISNISTQLTFVSNKKTLSHKEVSNAANLILSENLAKNVINHADVSLAKFSEENSKHSSRQEKAGILFPPSIAEKFLRNFGFSKIMVTKTAPVYFAAVLEYLVLNILELASNLARENNRIRVTIRDLELSVRTDRELSILFENCRLSFVGGGVVPKIHDSLLTKKPRKKRKTVVNKTTDMDKKNHRFRPGTVSLREIKKFQKTSNCLTFAKFPFERFVRSIVNKYRPNMKISKEVFIVLQYYIEQFIVDFLRDANSASIHCGRVKLMPTDISFICSLRRYNELDTKPFQKELETILESKISEENHEQENNQEDELIDE